MLDKLTELGLEDNTIVVFVSDHGYHLGDHNQWGKHTQLENGVHVPLIRYEPGMNPKECDSPIDLLDLYPTLTNMVFQTNPENTTGKSLVPYLQGNIDQTTVAVSEYRSSGHASYSFRNNKNRLTLWMKSSDDRPDLQAWKNERIFSAELFNYEFDRLERVNLYENSIYKDAVDSLLKSGELWWNSQYNMITGSVTGANFRKTELPLVPNPVKDYLRLPEHKTMDSNVRIYNLNGSLVFQKENPGNIIYVGNLKKGQYVVLLDWGSMDEVMNYSIIKI